MLCRPFPVLICAAASVSCAPSAAAALITYNSQTNADNATVRSSFYQAVGIPGPQIRVDFETGFVDEQNIAGVPGLFLGGLVIRDSVIPQVIRVQQGPGSIDTTGLNPSPSNPVGQFALDYVPRNFSDIVFDFSANPVDYFAFQDIDTDSNNSRVVLTLTDGTTQLFGLTDDTLTFGNSAEFLGFFRNDLPRISEVRLDFSGVGYGVDNVEYGIIPEPATALLVLGGIGCLATRRRRP